MKIAAHVWSHIPMRYALHCWEVLGSALSLGVCEAPQRDNTNVLSSAKGKGIML